MTQRTLRELIHFVRHPPKSIKFMREYIEEVFYIVGIFWALAGGGLISSLLQRRYLDAIVYTITIFPLLGITTRFMATKVAEELERVVKEGEWP